VIYEICIRAITLSYQRVRTTLSILLLLVNLLKLKNFEKLLLVIFIPGIYPEFTRNIAVLVINPRVVYLKQTRNLPGIYPALSG